MLLREQGFCTALKSPCEAKGGSDKSDVSFHPISLLRMCKQKLGKRNYFISGDQKLSLTSSQTKFGIMWVTQ